MALHFLENQSTKRIEVTYETHSNNKQNDSNHNADGTKRTHFRFQKFFQPLFHGGHHITVASKQKW